MTKKGFTLAEVLVTLGIIGVVASMTMPTLMSNHRKKVIVTRMEKFYSLINQADVSAQNEFGMMQDWAFPTTPYDADQMAVFYDKYYKPYIQTLRTDQKDGMLLVYMPDGSMFKVFNHNGTSKLLHLYFYPAGKEGRNVNGKDYFTFLVSPTLAGNKVEPYKFGWNGTRDALVNTGTYACKTKNHYCAALIQLDGWKIADDYPIKL